MSNKIISIALAAVCGVTATAACADTLADVKAKGHIQCGVTQGVAGFSAPDENNNWSGIEVDFCRAMAAAMASKFPWISASAPMRIYDEAGASAAGVLAPTGG